MSTTTSVHRSVRRWLNDLLSDDWTIHLESRFRSGEDVGRPLAWVEQVGATSNSGARIGGIPQGDYARSAAFVATLLPAGGELPQESTVEAMELAEMLQRSVEVGVVTFTPEPGTPTLVHPPMRFPVWDYDGVPVKGRNRQGPADPFQYADVLDVSSRAIPDPDSETLYAVALSLRLRWWTGGAVALPGEVIAETMSGTYTPIEP